MIARFFRSLSRSFCLYPLAFLNLMHAIEHQSFDWLLWVSLALAALSVILSLVEAVKEDRSND